MHRRTFLKQLGLLSASAAVPGFGLNGANAADEDYKALVCVYLQGGNDGANTIVPVTDGEYASYANIRGGIAIPRNQLVPLAQPGGAAFGLHPKLAPLEPVWSAGRMAVAFNVGPLVQPGLRRADYQRDPSQLPTNLFAHDVQSTGWMSADPQGVIRTGWGGRMLDLLGDANTGGAGPAAISLNGVEGFLGGDNAAGFSIPMWSKFGLDGLFGSLNAEAARRDALAQILAMNDGNAIVNAVTKQLGTSVTGANLMNAILAGASQTVDPFFANAPGDIGVQLKRVARLIEQRQRLGARRQIFTAMLGPFDTHGPQPAQHAMLLEQTGAAMRALYDALGALGVSNNVTIFTMSEFGRSLRTNGQGTEHGWGGHHVVMGGAVRGGRLLGTPPGMGFGTAEDFDGDGRWIPTLAIEQYAASIARWFGVPADQLGGIFPNAGRFNTGAIDFFA